MKEKIKVDCYSVYGKKRKYDILRFPDEKYMWAYDPHPGEDFFMIDGDKKALRNLAIAFAILSVDPSKIIYFPIKKNVDEVFFWESTHLLLVRPELQFRRSEWFRLKKHVDKKHWTGKYKFTYYPNELAEYMEKIWKRWDYPDMEAKEKKFYVEDILGDVMFLVVPKNVCLTYHWSLIDVLERYSEERPCISWYKGYLESDSRLEEEERVWSRKREIKQ